MTRIPKIKGISKHRLRATFTDGVAGDRNFSAIVQQVEPMVVPLHKAAIAAPIFLQDGAPTWANGHDAAAGWLRREIEATGSLLMDVA